MKAAKLRKALRDLENAHAVILELTEEDGSEAWLDSQEALSYLRTKVAAGQRAEPVAVEPADYEIIPTPGARIGCSWYA